MVRNERVLGVVLDASQTLNLEKSDSEMEANKFIPSSFFRTPESPIYKKRVSTTKGERLV